MLLGCIAALAFMVLLVIHGLVVLQARSVYIIIRSVTASFSPWLFKFRLLYPRSQNKDVFEELIFFYLIWFRNRKYSEIIQVC